MYIYIFYWVLDFIYVRFYSCFFLIKDYRFKFYLFKYSNIMFNDNYIKG